MVMGSNLHWQCVKIKAVYTGGGGLVREYARVCTLEGSAHWRNKFFSFVIETDQSEMTKSNMSDSKIAAKGKMPLAGI